MNQLHTKFSGYERQAAITELKRALVAIQGVTANSPEVQAKSGQVIASIETLLKELDGGAAMLSPMTPAPAAPAETLTPPPAEVLPAEAVTAEAEPEPAMEEEEPVEEKSPVGEISLETESSEGDDGDSGDDEEEEEEEEE